MLYIDQEDWHDHVGVLLNALEDADVDPIAWAKERDLSVLQGYIETHGDQKLHYALGFLTAVGLMTRTTIEDQFEAFYD